MAENPANWRTHPESQLRALGDVMGEVGWAGVILFNEATGHIVDGHGRKKLAIERGDKEVPVLVGSWTKAEERLILATFDPIGAAAEVDALALAKLLAEVETESEAVQKLLMDLAPDVPAVAPVRSADPVVLPEQYRILVVLDSDAEQAALLGRLTAEGFKCQSLIS